MRLPLQHLTGHAPFRHLELYVGTGVFVPRPETEIVAQVAIDELALRAELASRVVPISDEAAAVTPISPLRGVDLCAGSGAIALAMATEVPNAEVWGVELSREAFEYTQRNNAKYDDAVTFIRGDARTALHELDGTVEVVVSNPPYVPPGAVPRDREVAEHDPHIALFGLGPDGLEVPRGITDAAARLLKAGGLYVMEHAEVQDAAVRDMVSASTYFERVETRLDLTSRPRMVVAFRNDVAYVEGTVK
jgi:release factor glutamine methyltransferase